MGKFSRLGRIEAKGDRHSWKLLDTVRTFFQPASEVRKEYHDFESRQVLRAALRERAGMQMDDEHPEQPRRIRRLMARRRAARDYRKLMALTEPTKRLKAA